jgi:flagellar hook assembly protein FlgD
MWIDDVALQNLGTVDVATAPGRAIELAQNVPNPFSGSTRIDFALAGADKVDVSIYDMAGRRIANLYQGSLDAGPHAVSWNGRTSSGIAAAPGIYQYVVKTSTGRQSRSMLLLP